MAGELSLFIFGFSKDTQQSYPNTLSNNKQSLLYENILRHLHGNSCRLLHYLNTLRTVIIIHLAISCSCCRSHQILERHGDNSPSVKYRFRNGQITRLLRYLQLQTVLAHCLSHGATGGVHSLL